LDAPDRGDVKPPPRDVAVVHEDRHREGLVLEASVADNAVLGELARFTSRGVIDVRALEDEARTRVTRAQGNVNVGPADVMLPASALSGGNQQKIVVARALARGARAVVLAHPTRG